MRDIGDENSLNIVRDARLGMDPILFQLSYQVAEEIYWRLTGGLAREFLNSIPVTCSRESKSMSFQNIDGLDITYALISFDEDGQERTLMIPLAVSSARPLSRRPNRKSPPTFSSLVMAGRAI